MTVFHNPTVKDAIDAIEASGEILVMPQLGHINEWISITKKEAHYLFALHDDSMLLSAINVDFDDVTSSGTVYLQSFGVAKLANAT